MTKDENAMILKHIGLFAKMEDNERELIGSFCRERICRPNEIVYKENEHEEAVNLYIVIKGELKQVLKVKTRDGDDVEKAFRHYKEYDYFGDIEVFAGETQPASATIIALTECKLLVIDGKKLMTLLMKYPHLTIMVCEQFSQKVRELNKIHVTGDINV